ncbi:MAG: DUF6351 family protein [Solirubrobacterales bacterium]
MMRNASTRLSAVISLALALIAGLFFFGVGQAMAAGEVELDVVSSRADMASGGNSLVQVVVPPSGDPEALRVALDGSDVTSNFAGVAGNERKRRALLNLTGVGTVTATLPGNTTAKLLVVDHSKNGPILSGIRQTPYVCETPGGAINPADCNTTTKVEYRYRLESGGGWVTVTDPAQIPAVSLLRTTTTVPTGDRPTGVTVPQAIRVETGTFNRANYRIGFLVDPANPGVPGPGWNGRLIYGFGGGCTAGFVQGPINDGSYLRLNDVLGGYATTGSSQNVFGTRCSDSVSAETVSMVKEHFIEEFGEPDFVLGKGGSGGAMAQQMIGNNFPGLLDGLQISNSFTDNAFPGNQLMDCRLINEFLASPEAAGWSTEQKRAVKGLARETACAIVYAAFGENFFDPGGACPPELAANTVFDPATNPGGTRCLVYDGNINVYGKDPETGLTRRPVDNIGVQYGLDPLKRGVISVEQFLDLNDGVGGIRQYDGVSVPERSVATTEALRRAYDAGQLNGGGAGLASTPIIDNRNYNIETVDNGHQIIHALSMRERLLKANGDPDGNGSAGTQVIWTSPNSLDDSIQLLTMDRWLTGINNDTSSASQREKVLAHRPTSIAGSPAARDACFSNDTGALIAQQTQTDDSGVCGTTFPSSSGPRMEAGQPLANDILKCQLKPIDASEYGVALTGPQFARLQTIFPQGTCDNSKPGVEFQISRKTWRALPTSTTPDTIPPDTAISSSLKKRGQSGSVKQLFTSSETGSSFQCRYDTAAFTACTAPPVKTDMRVGYHSFEVRATDISGNTDPSPAKTGFIVGYPKATVAMRSNLIKFNRRARGYARVRCTLIGMKSCYGRATLSVKGKVFGAKRKAAKKDRTVASTKYKVKSGKRFIKLRLNRGARKVLNRRGSLRGRISFTVGQAGTSSKKVVRTVRLIRKR